MVIKVRRTITVSVVLYECEIWSPIARAEHMLMVFGNGLLRKI